MGFKNEAEFEQAIIGSLTEKGWEKEILKYKTEEDLINNWANILSENNKGIDRLNNCPLTKGEMNQILNKIQNLKTPLKLNQLINGKTITITRDNELDKEHLGREVSLKIYDRQEIAAGQSRYQIVQQPQFPHKSKILNDRRGDLMLLINGMPLIHIELKRSGVHVSQAYNQIEKYSREGLFTGLFSLIQIFVAMEPNETVYFANPGMDGKFNKDFYFHWANFHNLPMNDWKDITSHLLSIPMAHQLIGFYTVADEKDGILKVMRSYQYYAANKISNKVAMTKWDEKNIYGGYIWHTTGSGKTLTSFKSAQLIANSNDADKVVFLTDRIELGVQTLVDYQNFADDRESVQATENTSVLLSKLKSSNSSDTLIVTSIQKMSNIKENGLNNNYDLELINAKRLVFIVDEAHRSTFGDMLKDIKETFPTALFFGFTGTPIQDENQKKLNTTATIFGDELHRYSIADGLRDKNVLGFDPYKVSTYDDRDLKEVIGLEHCKANTIEEVMSDEKVKKTYFEFIKNTPMAGYYNDSGKYIKGIEDYLSRAQYDREEHREIVVNDIIDNWNTLSYGKKFHAIFATSSIKEAIKYYKLFKEKCNLKITALFDESDDNNSSDYMKHDGLVEILQDFNNNYEQSFTLRSFKKFKKDVASRLAHKKPYKMIERMKGQEIDLLIVVDQMLTGFDSKWINTLYLDKTLKYENIIQSFSRTNRLYGPEKPFGTIKYYRKPHTMEKLIEEAFELYSGNCAYSLRVNKLLKNIAMMNSIFNDIDELFQNAGIENFIKLPEKNEEKGQFAKLFKELNIHLEASKLQGFNWKKLKYKDEETKNFIKLIFDETIYLTLAQRYKELFNLVEGGDIIDVPYEIEGYLTEINTEAIDIDYMNSRFEKFIKLKNENVSSENIQNALEELHKTFATLNQTEQKYADIFLKDVQSGAVIVDDNKTFRDYIYEYEQIAKNDRIHKKAIELGLDEEKLREFMSKNVKESNIDEFGRFTDLKKLVDFETAKEYFEKEVNTTLKKFKVNLLIDKDLRDFVLGKDLDA